MKTSAVVVNKVVLDQLLRILTVDDTLKDLTQDLRNNLYVLPAELEVKIGEMLVSSLNMKVNKDGRVNTNWGTKTPVGLFRTMVNQIEELESSENHVGCANHVEVTPLVLHPYFPMT